MAHLVTLIRKGDERPFQEVVIGGNPKDLALEYMLRPTTQSLILQEVPYGKAISNKIKSTGI